tara:strand:+ start:123677 stop:124561 length:885 start_codon:yes stop_codon:yes gene_type:complete
MNRLGVALFPILFSIISNAHNIKLTKNNTSTLENSSVDLAFNNEFYIKDEDTFFEGYLGYTKSKNTLDQSDSDNKNIGLQIITPSFLSLNVSTGQYSNSSEELKTKTLNGEVGQKFFYGQEVVDGFKPNFGVKVKGERIGMDQSKTFARRKFDFSLEQTSSGISLSAFPIYWFELTGSYYRFNYNQDVESIKTKLNRSEVLSSLFSNVANTLDSLSDVSQSISLRFLPTSWIDATITRTYSDDIISDTQYYVDSIDIGIYYFSRVHIFASAGENYSSISTSKTNFNEFALQFNF